MPPCSSSLRPGSPSCRCHRASARTRTCPGSRRRPRRAVPGADTQKRCSPTALRPGSLRSDPLDLVVLVVQVLVVQVLVDNDDVDERLSNRGEGQGEQPDDRCAEQRGEPEEPQLADRSAAGEQRGGGGAG